MDPEQALRNKVIVMNGFSQQEILQIMRTVKALFDEPRDLIFATTTKTNLDFKLRDLIQDLSEDHEYLRNNPPPGAGKQSGSEGPGEQQ